MDVAPFKAKVEKMPPKRYLDSLETLAKEKEKELAKIGLKAGAIAKQLGYHALTSDLMQELFIAKADELLKKHYTKEANKRKKEEKIHSKAQQILASGKDPAAMSKADLEILLRDKGIKPGADKATCYDMYINSL